MIWPTLAHRVPAFDSLKVTHSWSGHYEYDFYEFLSAFLNSIDFLSVNEFDQNAIIDYHPVIRNLIVANGFTGHGMQQSPAVGRGISELIVDGKFTSLDLSELGVQRVLDKRPIIEQNVI